MSLYETTLTSETLLEGYVFRVERQDVRLGDGSHGKRDIVRHIGGVGALARKPCGTWVLVRQFRKAVDCEVTEIVAGMREPGEAPEDAIRRELEEETGHLVEKLTPLGRAFASPGYTDEVVHLFFAEISAEPGSNRLDHDERVEVVEFSDAELRRAIGENELPDAKTMVAWMLACRKGLA